LRLLLTATATIAFRHQVDRQGVRTPLKTDESKAVLPLPRSAAMMLLEHKARSPFTGPQAFVFATRTGRPLGQRNVLRALYPGAELFEHDLHGNLVVDRRGGYVLRAVKRRELWLPDFHALRHAAAMECEDAEEARDLLRHKNSNVTRAVYRAHFGNRRREQLRVRLEARHGSSIDVPGRSGAQHGASAPTGEIIPLQEIRDEARQSTAVAQP
jgi:integrase